MCRGVAVFASFHEMEAFSSKICRLEDATCLYCEYDPSEGIDHSVSSNFHLQILKSRIIIFGLPDALVSPDPRKDTRVAVLFNRTTTDAHLVQNFLNTINMKIEHSTGVSLELFEMCFKYTLKAKLAPLWNPIDINMLVKDRNFLTCSEPLCSVTIDVHAANECLNLQIKPNRLRMNSLDVKDLDVSSRAMHYFNNVADAVLSEHSFMDLWVHVLPSLKKGKIITIHKKMPQSSTFQSYRELRRHWKNIYGYRLPEDEDKMIFCQIFFQPLGPQLYTYPSICVRPNIPCQVELPYNEKKKILDAFIQDIHSQLPYTLGFKTSFHPLNYTSMLTNSTIHPPIKIENFSIIQQTSLNKPTEEDDDFMEDLLKNHTPLKNEGIQNIKPSYSVNRESNNKVVPIFHTNANDFNNGNVTNSNLNGNVNLEVDENTPIVQNNENLNKIKPMFTSNNNKALINNLPITDKDKKESFLTESQKKLMNQVIEKPYCPYFFTKLSKNTKPQKNTVILSNEKSSISPQKIISSQKAISEYFQSVKDSSSTNLLSNDNDSQLSPSILTPKISFKTKNKPLKKSVSTDDIVEMVRNNSNGLNKLSIAILCSWLCSQNVYIPKKSSKQVYVDKVVQVVTNKYLVPTEPNA